MKVREPRNWNLRPAEARELQERLRRRVVLVDRWKPIRTVAGADIALDARSGVGFSGVVVYRFPRFGRGRAAARHPEAYLSLYSRVAGFSRDTGAAGGDSETYNRSRPHLLRRSWFGSPSPVWNRLSLGIASRPTDRRRGQVAFGGPIRRTGRRFRRMVSSHGPRGSNRRRITDPPGHSACLCIPGTSHQP